MRFILTFTLGNPSWLIITIGKFSSDITESILIWTLGNPPKSQSKCPTSTSENDRIMEHK